MKNFPLVVGLALAGCGGARSDNTDNLPPMRQGEVMRPFEMAYYDGEASLSEDGARIVFESGRDSQFKIYKKDATSSNAPSRLTGADFGAERFPIISPDGNFVAFWTIKDGITSLYVARYAEASTPVAVNLDGLLFPNGSSLSFSKGSSPLLAVHYLDSSGKGVNAVVAVSFDGTNLTAGTPTVISNVGGSESEPQWLSATSPFTLITKSESVGGQWFIKRQFNDAALGGLSSAEIGKTISRMDPSVPFTAADNALFFAVKPLERVEVPFGDKQEDEAGGVTKGKIAILSEPQKLLLSDESKKSLESEQFEVKALSATRDGSILVSLGKEVFACQHKDVWGTSMIIHQSGSETPIRVFLKKSGEGFEVTNEICASYVKDLPAEEKPMDMALNALKMAKSPAAGLYRLVYQNLYYQDQELFLLEFKIENAQVVSAVVKAVSDNRKPN